MFSIYGGATEFKQWELDKFVTNPCMKEGDEVVFRNSHGETYVVKAFAQGSEILADVPNYLLKTADNILVDLEQGNDRHPECRTTFTVVAQDKPDGYECKYNVPDRTVASGGVVKLPWGETTTVKEVLAECQPEFVADMGIFMLAGDFPIVAGETYIVNWNGKDYPCGSALGSGDSSSGEICFGNASAVGGEDSGEPFFVDYQYSDRTENNGLAIIPLDGSTTLTISIRQEVTTVQKMSGKYVEGMGYKEKKTETLFDGTVTTSGGFAPQYTPVNFKVVEGGVYEVTHDGKTYTVEAVSDGYGNFYIGDITLFNSPGSGSGDIPFCYCNGWYCASQDGAHAVKIIGTFDSVNKIDEEFLPERTVIIPVGLAPGFNGGSEEANLVCNKTPAEIFDLIESGAMVLIRWGGRIAVMHSYMDNPSRGASFVCLTADENFVRFGHTIAINEQGIKLYAKAPGGIYLRAGNGDYYLLQVNNSGVVEATKTSYPGNGM